MGNIGGPGLRTPVFWPLQMRQVECGDSARAVGSRRHGRRTAKTDGTVLVPEGKDRRRTQRRGFRENDRRRTGCRQRRCSDESQTQI